MIDSESDAAAKVRDLYRRHQAGCCLHLVTDDGNVDDESVAFCLEYARRNSSGECKDTEACIDLAKSLLQLSESARERVWWSRPPEDAA